MDIGKCTYCKDSFPKKRRSSRFCGEKCRKAWYYENNPAYYERTVKHNREAYHRKKKSNTFEKLTNNVIKLIEKKGPNAT